jgi:diguanylate cyclase (GGDEF)-like protein
VYAESAVAGTQIGGWIAATGERPRIVLAGSAGQAREETEDVDLVVTDLRVRELGSRGLLARLLTGEIHPRVPRIHLYRDEQERLEIAEGGPDALLLALPYPEGAAPEMQARVRLAAEVGRLRRERSRNDTHDPATGLSSRRFLVRRLEEELARARRHRTQMSIVVFDVDRLAAINEGFGLAAGDSVLERFAAVLRRQVRREDVAGRLHGATFAVVLPSNGHRGAAIFAHKVRTDVEEIAVQHADEIHRVHVSAGITTYPDSPSATTGERLLREAETALQEAKARGGNRVFIDDTVLRHERRVVLVADPDRELLDVAEDLLAADDWQIVRADSARALLETLRFRRPDLLVIDLQMAEERGDAPLLEQIRKIHPAGGFPVIGLSSDPWTTPERLAQLGVDRFLTKPFSVSLLRAAARELLDGARARLR